MMKESDVKAPEGPTLPRATKKGRKDSKTPLKEKFVQIYESFFNGDDPSVGNGNFWDELFLLKVNGVFLDRCITSLSEEQLMSLKDMTSTIFHHCALALRNESIIRVGNAVQTLCILMRAVATKKFAAFSFDPIALFANVESAASTMKDFFSDIASILTSESPVSVKAAALKLLVVMSTIHENVNVNMFIELMMQFDMFDPVVHTLVDPQTRDVLSQDAFTLLVILINYRKYEAPNHYVKRVSEVNDELLLNSLGAVMSNIYGSYNRYFDNTTNPAKSSKGGFLSSITSWFGGDTAKNTTKSWNPETACPVLLSLYEAIHLNRNFFSVLCYLDPMLSTDLAAMLSSSKDGAAPGGKTASSSSPAPSSSSSSSTSLADVHQQGGTNLLSKFLTFCSYVFQAIKDERSIENARLCLIVLTCISEDAYSNAFLHDPSTNINVSLYRRPTRHKRPSVSNTTESGRPLASSFFDLVIEFLGGNLKRNLQVDLYCKCIGITHRLLCYEKKSRVRLNYLWKELWSSLVSVLRFVLSNESSLAEKHNVFLLYDQTVNLFNIFITYGDTFLPNPTNYDELYYEIIRVHEVFQNVYESAKRHYSVEGEWRETARRVMTNIVNILSIINHFSPKIEAWTAENQVASVTPEQVLNVIKNNYDTLTLKLQDNLDLYDRYIENPKEVTFFRNCVRHLTSDTRQSMAGLTFDAHADSALSS